MSFPKPNKLPGCVLGIEWMTGDGFAFYVLTMNKKGGSLGMEIIHERSKHKPRENGIFGVIPISTWLESSFKAEYNYIRHMYNFISEVVIFVSRNCQQFESKHVEAA